jgi:heterodisulfide reductase subunit A-like polyferredoxin
MKVITPICVGCKKHPKDIDEYAESAKAEGMTPDAYVRMEEGTYNRDNGHFLCTDCYCAAGCPSTPNGWVAP